MKLFTPSIEGAQHGPKGLNGFLAFARAAGATGCQPSNYMLESANGGFLPAQTIKTAFGDIGLTIDGISAHCPFWVHTTAWTTSPTIRPFISPLVAKESPAEIERLAENYILQLLELCAELGVKIVPMFWGVAFGWELATGYPWGFWKGGSKKDGTFYDLIEEGKERFRTKTQRIRDAANRLGIYLAHEIHPGTAAMCADDFNTLVDTCDDDDCLTVIADPSHCWEGENWQKRFTMPGIAERVVACHLKNHIVHEGMPLRCMAPDWPNRPMQFSPLHRGDIDLVQFTEMLINIGYPKRYCKIMGTKTAPLVVEAEAAFQELDLTSQQGIAFVDENCCFELATGSFEEGMGA